MARKPIVWRVLLSSKQWNQETFQEVCATDPAMKRLPVAKGASHMVEYPCKGDGVIFIHKNKVVMSGIAQQDGFTEGSNHQDLLQKGDNRCYSGTPVREFIWVQIHELGLSLDTGHVGKFPWKGQRTWIKVAE